MCVVCVLITDFKPLSQHVQIVKYRMLQCNFLLKYNKTRNRTDHASNPHLLNTFMTIFALQVFYCSVDCQRLAWTVGNHKRLCKKWSKNLPTADKEAAALNTSTETEP